MESEVLFQVSENINHSFDCSLTENEEKELINQKLINRLIQPSDLVKINTKFGALTTKERDDIYRDEIKANVESLLSSGNVTLKDLKIKLSNWNLKSLDVFGVKIKNSINPKNKKQKPFSYFMVFVPKQVEKSKSK